MIALAVALSIAVVFNGLITRTKSLLSGRQGPGIMQYWSDVWRLCRKSSVISPVTSIIFGLGPLLSLVSVSIALCIVPIGDAPALLSFRHDVVLMAYVLALGRFFAILAALDTGSPFEGMGANREALYGLLLEPSVFILIGSLAALTGAASLTQIMSSLHVGHGASWIIAILGAWILLYMSMIENSRLPVDDPKTHLELTMVHEVMILDHSGLDLAMLHTGMALRFALYGLLMANILLPTAVTIWLRVVAAIGVAAVMAIAIGVLESFRARYRMKRNPQFILTLTTIAIMVFFTVLVLTSNIGF